ncbi:MAG: hypothetical protein SOY45_02870 [Lachnospiraceae bacterium]|nr:hypothetical protein [Lachnospiraceae bacterium]
MNQKKAVNIQNMIFPILLLLFPLRHINQGIDISDTGYNLACFRYFGELDGMWVYVSYLANMVGHIFTKLPLGDTMLGMNLYCSLIVSLIALCAWFFLKDKIPGIVLFVGVALAEFLCWCPQVILYNYLTYLALMVGTILLYQGIVKNKRGLFVLAGLVLGLGVGARFSNLTHMALILGLWYYAFLKRRRIREVICDTVCCMGGYVAGIGAFLLMIEMQYGLAGYWDMLFGLQTMTDNAAGYSASDMILGAFIDYAGSMKWGILFLIYLALGLALFGIRKGSHEKLKKGLFLIGFVVLLRLVYGRGMFGLDYNTYFSFFWWVCLFNVVAIVCCVLALFRKDVSDEMKLLACLVLVTILILPLGSNNRSHPVNNDLFLIAPVTLYFLQQFLPKNFSVRTVAAGCLAVLLVQSVNFGMTFVFRDGTFTEKRDTKVENNGILKGMYTTKSNADSLTSLTDYCEREGLRGQPVILYGDIPGISYVMNMPSAITSTWSNLESYNMTFWERDFEKVEAQMDSVRPVVMIGKLYEPTDGKAASLQDFLDRYGYMLDFETDRIAVYR